MNNESGNEKNQYTLYVTGIHSSPVVRKYERGMGLYTRAAAEKKAIELLHSDTNVHVAAVYDPYGRRVLFIRDTKNTINRIETKNEAQQPWIVALHSKSIWKPTEYIVATSRGEAVKSAMKAMALTQKFYYAGVYPENQCGILPGHLYWLTEVNVNRITDFIDREPDGKVVHIDAVEQRRLGAIAALEVRLQQLQLKQQTNSNARQIE